MSLFEQDRALLDAFRRGERDALTRVYLHYVDELDELVRRGFSVESGGRPLHVPGAASPDEEAEVIQETFVRAFSEPARSAYDGVRPFRPYLFRIAKNLMIDRLRARRKEAGSVSVDAAAREHHYVVGVDAPLAVVAAAAPPEGDLDWSRQFQATQQFLAEIDREMRELVRFRFEEEKSQEATALLLGVSRRRVRTLEARVIAGLRRHLKRAGLLRAGDDAK